MQEPKPIRNEQVEFQIVATQQEYTTDVHNEVYQNFPLPYHQPKLKNNFRVTTNKYLRSLSKCFNYSYICEDIHQFISNRDSGTDIQLRTFYILKKKNYSENNYKNTNT